MTAQAMESLVFNSERLRMCTTPLDIYLVQRGIQFYSETTANWRGYIGSWEIKGSEELGYRLYLVELSASIAYQNRVRLEYLFPDYPNGIFAHWFSGEIRCPRGDRLHYVHGGYASIYEEDLFLNFNQGVLQGTRVVKNEPPPPVNRDDYPPYLKARG